METFNVRRSQRMEQAAFILGIIAILSLLTVYGPLVCGSMAIAMALLSKGGTKSMTQRAKTGMIMGIIALAIVAAFTAYVVFIAETQYGGIEDMLRQMYSSLGLDFDSVMESYM